MNIHVTKSGRRLQKCLTNLHETKTGDDPRKKIALKCQQNSLWFLATFKQIVAMRNGLGCYSGFNAILLTVITCLFKDIREEEPNMTLLRHVWFLFTDVVKQTGYNCQYCVET